MYENPSSLEELCLDTICDNISTYIEIIRVNNESNVTETTGTIEKKYKFKDPDLFLINEISEKLLQKLVERNILCDSTMNLFTEHNTRLRSVKLKNCKLTQNGLAILKQHKITDMECVNLKNIGIGNILDCLSKWSISNITSVNFSKCSFIDLSRHSFMVKIINLRNLRCLNLSQTELNQSSFQMICEDLKFLEKLDISGTLVKDLSPLSLLSTQLTYLSISDLSHAKNLVSTVTTMDNLRYLDLSLFNEKIDNDYYLYCPATDLLKRTDKLSNLVSLDISGYRDFIQSNGGILDKYLDTHEKLEFLGLVINDLCFDQKFSNEQHRNYPKHIKIAGIGNETQIKIALKKYSERSTYIQKILYHLFQLTNTFNEARPDIFNLVLPVMQLHGTKFGVQMAATACLYNLTRGDLSKCIHPKSLGLGVNLTLQAMETFPDEFQLQKNSLLTLCSDTILQDINFDRFRCAKLVLDALCAFEEINMNRMAVAICSILAAKVSTEQTSELGAHPIYMRKLLAMVQNRVNTKMADITLKFTLSALWNLTDESAATCTVFLEQGGAYLFLNVLKTFKNDCAIETKVLGLLNNIAEVVKLRENLMLDTLISELYLLLKSDNIDVSYFAAGIIAHLASDGKAMWIVDCYTRDDMLNQLELAVLQWNVPDSEMVAYRSFKPFFPLLNIHMDYQVQLWAVWAIHHVCTKNPKRYCVMLEQEKGHLLLNELLMCNTSHPDIKLICSQILDTLETNH